MQTPLLIAAKYSKPSVVRVLLAAGAQTDRAEMHGATPISVAAGNGDVETVQALLEGGPDLGGGLFHTAPPRS